MIHGGGFAATGIKDIVAGAGVPKGLFYNHFASKEAFGAEVANAYFEESLTSMRAIVQDAQTAPLDRLRRYFDDRASRLRANGYSRGCLLGNLTLEPADHSDLIRERTAAHFDTWAKLSRTPGQFLLSSWEGALLRARSEKSDRPLREFVEVAFGAVLL